MDNCEVISCFDSLIGVKGCHNETTCKLLVNDLPGISNELLDKIADGDQETYFDVFTKARKSSINSLKDDVQETLLTSQTRYKFGSTVFASEKSRVIKPIESNEFTEEYISILLTTADSKYILARFNSVSLYPLNECSVYAKIIDYETNETVFESGDIGIDLVPNQINVIEFDGFNIDCTNQRALILLLQRASGSANLELAKLSCNRYKESDCKTCDPCDSIDSIGFGTISDIPFELLGLDQVNEFAIYPFASDSETDLTNATPIENYICADIELICSIEQFICQNAERLASALVYKVGANLLLEKLGGYRVNNHAKGNLEFTRDVMEDLKKEYQKRLDKIVPTLPLSGDSMCWHCDNNSGAYYSSLV